MHPIKQLGCRVHQLNRQPESLFRSARILPEIQLSDIPPMTDRGNRKCNPLYPVPRLMDRRELEDLYDLLIPKEELS